MQNRERVQVEGTRARRAGGSVSELRETRHPRNVKFNEVFETCFFRGRKLTIFGSLEPAKPKIRESVKFGNLDS
jgi:hypothetical protein